MQTEKTNMLLNASSEKLANEIVKILLEKNGMDVSLFDVRSSSHLTDFYINVTGKSLTQVAALADYVIEGLSERGRDVSHVEGKRGASWILVDCTDCILNVFDREGRAFYDLDKHFPSDSKIDISDLIKEVDNKFKIN